MDLSEFKSFLPSINEISTNDDEEKYFLMELWGIKSPQQVLIFIEEMKN